MSQDEIDALKNADNAVADYLSQFEKSPYSYPSNGLKRVNGKMTEKGCWHQQK